MVAVGGDLSPNRLLNAYGLGIFPWFDDTSPILWWSPDPRLILEPHQFIVSRSLNKTLKKPFCYTIDKAFHDVIEACAHGNGRAGNTWITQDMINSYTVLYELGYAHSFEVWFENKLVGGLYGVSLGRAFFGESMFHCIRDASKLAFYFLCQTLQSWQFELIDCQLPTAHLQSLGARTISRQHFLNRLHKALEKPTCVGKWLYP